MNSDRWDRLSSSEKATLIKLDRRLERLARALCELKGDDPDCARVTEHDETVLQGNSLERRAVKEPNWYALVPEAGRFLVLQDAL